MKYDFPMVVWVILKRAILLVQKPFRLIRSYVICKAYGVSLGAGKDAVPTFIGQALISTRRKGEVSIGRSCIFDADVTSNLVGLSGPTILDTRHGGKIVIGNHSGFSAVVISSKSEVQIGDNVKCGGNVRIFDHDFHSLLPETRAVHDLDVANIRSRPVFIGDDVFIGTNAIILKGSRIGAGSIVAAGAVVFGLDAPQNSLIKGNPAIVMETKR